MSRARGALTLNDHAFFVIGTSILDYDSNGLHLTHGPIIDDGLPAYMAANFFQLVIVSGKKAYFIEAGVLQEVPWLVGTPVLGVGMIDQYFVFLAEASFGQENGFFYSEPGDVKDGDLLNFISAEASANKYKRLIVHDEQVWLFGELRVQPFYDNSSSDPDNPFQANLSAVIQMGTVAPFSVTQVAGALCWVGKNEYGQGVAYQNEGYRPSRISTFGVEEQWRKYSRIDDAWGYSISWRGHIVWRIWFPTASETWQYDASLPPSLGWSKILWQNPITGKYEADRGSTGCFAFGKTLVGDRENGKIYELSPDFLDDAGDRIRWVRRAPILHNENTLISFPWFELAMETGVGDGTNTDPTFGDVTPEADPLVMMRYSDDWGRTWGNERLRSIGKQGEFKKRVVWMKNGIARNRTFEVSGSASVPIAIANVYLRDPGVRKT